MLCGRWLEVAPILAQFLGIGHAWLAIAWLRYVDFSQRFEDIASYINPMSPTELRDYIRAEQSLWKPVIEQIATFKAAPK